MGGSGSTRWEDYTPKRTVDDCFVLPVDFLSKENALQNGHSGILRWGDASIGIETEGLDAPYFLILTLKFTVKKHGKIEAIEQKILIVPVFLNGNGQRWQFQCPIPECEKMTRKLYMPRDNQRFACRGCHRLTYPSSQNSRKLGKYW